MILNNLDLNKLNTFLVVAEEGGISAAAKKLLLTRSALSQSVTSLEAALGTPLFNRVGKKLILTSEGKHLVESTRKYQAGLARALGQLGHRAQEIRGTVRIGLFIGFSKARLTDFLADFLARESAVQVRIRFVSQADLARLLIENRIDLALSLYPLNQEAKSIASARLFHEELVLVSGKKHFLAKPTLQQIRALPFIDYYSGGPLARQWIRHHFGKDAGDLNTRAFGAATDFVLEMILKDVGVGIVPKHVAEPEIKRGRLFQMRTGRSELVDSIWLNELKGFHHPAAAQRFLEEIHHFTL